MLRAITPIAALIVAIVGGAFLGFFWCGGYAWHSNFVHALIAGSAMVVLAFPPSWLASATRRIGFVASLVVSFLVARAAAAAFYPATPTSFADFASHFTASFWSGPC